MQTSKKIKPSPENDFKEALKSAVELGEWPDPRYGLGTEVFDAVGKVADSFPDVDESLVEKAQKVFATYTHRRAAIYG